MSGGGHFNLAGQQDAAGPVVARDEGNSPEGCGAHARQIVQPGKKLLIELQQPGAFVTALLRLQAEDQQVFLIEAEVVVI